MKKLALVQDWSSPYKSKNNDSMEEYYEAYRSDSSGIIEQNGEKYFRIIAKCLMKIGEDLYYLVSVDRKIGINPTSVFEDENGNHYKYYTKVYYHFEGKVPKWYIEAPEIMLETKTDSIGEYLKLSS